MARKRKRASAAGRATAFAASSGTLVMAAFALVLPACDSTSEVGPPLGEFTLASSPLQPYQVTTLTLSGPMPSGPVQFRLFARMRETVVLPMPRVPVNR